MNTPQSLLNLKNYCERENFSGWDPYDGLNSRFFQFLPIRKWDIARLVWIQAFKRSPINLRPLLLVSKEHNAKGVGLFLTAYCNLYTYQQKTGDLRFGSEQELIEQINYLAELLLSLQSKGYAGACWGYNFDWQARRLFLFPKNTPTVVATTFCATALFKAYEITRNTELLEVALSSAKFVLNDLNRTYKKRGFLFSYSPLEGNDTVYNASLLGSKLLSYCYHYTGIEEYKVVARESIEACVDAQQPDGAWLYGELPIQNWIDSFHTGYNLDAIMTYQQQTGDNQYADSVIKGFQYYIDHFFTPDGVPKYYHDKTYPIDIHCPAQLFVTLHTMQQYAQNRQLASQVMKWTTKHMQDKKGYFYYQLKKGISSRIPYMRWSNAFMMYAMSYYMLNSNLNNE